MDCQKLISCWYFQLFSVLSCSWHIRYSSLLLARLLLFSFNNSDRALCVHVGQLIVERARMDIRWRDLHRDIRADLLMERLVHHAICEARPQIEIVPGTALAFPIGEIAHVPAGTNV